MDQDVSNAEDAFAVLANAVRLQILEALADAPDEVPRSFTELYDGVDTSNTSQFSYHLNELTGRYVQHTEEGYVLSDAGRRIVQSVRAGEYTLEPDFEPVEVSTYCPYCEGTSAEATYDGRFVPVDCLSCGNAVLRCELRPAHVTNRDPLQALKAADRQARAEFGSALDGVCQRCGGSVQTELIHGSESGPPTAVLACDCRHCGSALSAPVELSLVHHPEVISHCWERDLDALTAPTWELLSFVSDWEVDATGTTAEVTIESRRITVRPHQGVSFEW